MHLSSPWEIILNFLLKCEGCTHFCEIRYIWRASQESSLLLHLVPAQTASSVGTDPAHIWPTWISHGPDVGRIWANTMLLSGRSSWSELISLGEKSSSWPSYWDSTWARTIMVVTWFAGKYTSFLPVFTTLTVTSCSPFWISFISVCASLRVMENAELTICSIFLSPCPGVSSILFTISSMTLYPIIGSSATVGSLDTNMGTFSNGVGKGPPSSWKLISTQPMNGISVLLAARPVRVASPNNSSGAG